MDGQGGPAPGACGRNARPAAAAWTASTAGPHRHSRRAPGPIGWSDNQYGGGHAVRLRRRWRSEVLVPDRDRGRGGPGIRDHGPAVEKHFRQAQDRAAQGWKPGTLPYVEQDIGREAYIRRTMPLFLTLRDPEGVALATAMLPPEGRPDRGSGPSWWARATATPIRTMARRSRRWAGIRPDPRPGALLPVPTLRRRAGVSPRPGRPRRPPPGPAGRRGARPARPACAALRSRMRCARPGASR